MWPNPQETVDSVTFTEEILNGKFHFVQVNCFLLSCRTILICLQVSLSFMVGFRNYFHGSWSFFLGKNMWFFRSAYFFFFLIDFIRLSCFNIQISLWVRYGVTWFPGWLWIRWRRDMVLHSKISNRGDVKRKITKISV